MHVKWDNIYYEMNSFSLELDLSLKKGELVTLLGPSGCGKTTALRIAAGFLTPNRGNFIIQNKILNSVSPAKRNIGIVFQNYALFPHLNVEQNISYGLKIRNKNKNIIKDEVEFLLESLHLKNYNNRDINSLSGGEKQRVALGRSLAIKPELLLLDEPLSALDAELRKKLRYEIKNIQKEFKITTLYITHDQEEALSVSDRVALLKNGRLQQFSTPEELYAKPVNKFVGQFIGESNTLFYNGKEIFFRPESVQTGHSTDSINFSGKITNTEFLGHYNRATLETESFSIKIITNKKLVSRDYHVKYKDIISL